MTNSIDKTEGPRRSGRRSVRRPGAGAAAHTGTLGKRAGEGLADFYYFFTLHQYTQHV